MLQLHTDRLVPGVGFSIVAHCRLGTDGYDNMKQQESWAVRSASCNSFYAKKSALLRVAFDCMYRCDCIKINGAI